MRKTSVTQMRDVFSLYSGEQAPPRRGLEQVTPAIERILRDEPSTMCGKGNV
jgi:hypothetical protein